jgi:putative FmdB family regulatory protein
MPTYEYECQSCKHNFDEFQGINDAPLKKCPRCGRKKLQRKFGTGAAVLFKGSGFYQTDYRSESYKAAAKAEDTSSKPAKDSTAASADTAAPATAGNGAKSTGKSSKSKG